MPYLNYNLPIQRTGFRPYGHTNPWSATQLSGLGVPGRPRQVFSEPGGRRLFAGMGLGQWQSGFSPAVLHGLAGDPNCDSGMPYDVNGNPCFATTGYNVPDVVPAPAGSVAPLCSGPGGDFISCSDPSCKFGPCIPSTGAGAGTVALSPGSSPRVPVPVTQFPQTSPHAAACAPGYVYNSASLSCVPLASGSSASSALTNYLPWLIGGIAVVALLGSRR